MAMYMPQRFYVVCRHTQNVLFLIVLAKEKQQLRLYMGRIVISVTFERKTYLCSTADDIAIVIITQQHGLAFVSKITTLQLH